MIILSDHTVMVSLHLNTLRLVQVNIYLFLVYIFRVLIYQRILLYFTFNKDIAPADYKKWTADRVEKELLPLLDEHACDDTLTTKQGSSIKWPEFRRKGDGLVIHMQDMDNFSVNVEAPADSIKCPL